jgi:hypothetical protein
MPSIYVIPKNGLKVRHPDTGGYLPEAGALVEDSSYWRRRLRDEDVTLGEAPAKKKGDK